MQDKSMPMPGSGDVTKEKAGTKEEKAAPATTPEEKDKKKKKPGNSG